jgi:hypothetical protein
VALRLRSRAARPQEAREALNDRAFFPDPGAVTACLIGVFLAMAPPSLRQPGYECWVRWAELRADPA